MGRIVAFTNQKGGVGKTTTCINLAASLVSTGRRVLLVDLDPQGNATMGSGVDKLAIGHTGCDVLLGEVSIHQAIVDTEHAGYRLLPSNSDLTAAEVRLMELDNREYRLRDALVKIRDDYDYLLVDCPPALNILTINGLAAADGVVIPVQCEYYALEGLSGLLDTIEHVRNTVNPDLQVDGLLRTMFDARNNLANEVSEQLMQHFRNKVYRTVIPRNVRLAEAPSHGLPILVYDKASRGAIAYLALAGEVVRRGREQIPAQPIQPTL
ncbi:MAG: AAA family ATPase [Gammaproteobacteria bacterium]